MAVTSQDDAVDRPCALYRYFDQDGVLLYVGISVDPEMRWKTHRYSHAGWVVDSVRRVDDWYSSVAEAKRAERAAIKAEHPKHNLQHSGRSYRRVPKPIDRFEWHWIERPVPDGGLVKSDGSARIIEGGAYVCVLPEPYPEGRGYWYRRKLSLGV